MDERKKVLRDSASKKTALEMTIFVKKKRLKAIVGKAGALGAKLLVPEVPVVEGWLPAGNIMLITFSACYNLDALSSCYVIFEIPAI